MKWFRKPIETISYQEVLDYLDAEIERYGALTSEETIKYLMREFPQDRAEAIYNGRADKYNTLLDVKAEIYRIKGKEISKNE